MEQMHGRGGEEHTHTHTQSSNTLHTAGSLQGLPLPYEDWQ